MNVAYIILTWFIKNKPFCLASVLMQSHLVKQLSHLRAAPAKLTAESFAVKRTAEHLFRVHVLGVHSSVAGVVTPERRGVFYLRVFPYVPAKLPGTRCSAIPAAPKIE
jgi:hypothetical protein